MNCYVYKFLTWIFESKFDTKKIQRLGHTKFKQKTEDEFELRTLDCRRTSNQYTPQKIIVQ